MRYALLGMLRQRIANGATQTVIRLFADIDLLIMTKTKIQDKAPAQATPQSVVQKQPETPEKQGGPAPAAPSMTGALPPPNGRPPAARAGEMMAGSAPGVGAPHRARMATGMQQTVGNARVSRMMGTAVQPKLTVGEPNDIYEQEADRVADAVMRMPDSFGAVETSGAMQHRSANPQRPCPECEKKVARRPFAEGRYTKVGTTLSAMQEVQRKPDDGPRLATTETGATHSRRSSLAELLIEWHGAGLLDPPFRPSSIDEIPPLQVTEEEARTLGLGAVAGGVAVARPLPTPTTPVRPPLRVIPGGGGAPAPRPVPGPLRWLGPIGVGLTVLLTPTPTAPPWMDELNPITGEPYSSPDEYRWVRRLTPDQQDYLRWLNRARRLSPEPTIEDDPSPSDLPVPLPQPAPRPREDENEPPCFASPVPRRGGHRRHDAYATKVTGTASDYYVRSRRGSSITYDGTSLTVLVWEVKVGYGWFFNPAYQSLRDRKLAQFDAQKNLGLAVAQDCRYLHIWSLPDRWVAGLLNARWGSIPIVLSIPE